jgi:riboflavin kinase/FMN adenylyltransferase
VTGLTDVTEARRRSPSSRIREALQEGDIPRAAALLGRPYAMDGIVAKGDRMGRKIGIPTINLKAENELAPRDGVYVGKVFLRSFERTFICVTNIGRRPTVYEDYLRTIESHILDFSSDVYGESVRLFFFGRLRDEMTFGSMLELTAQIRRDIEATRPTSSPILKLAAPAYGASSAERGSAPPRRRVSRGVRSGAGDEAAWRPWRFGIAPAARATR